MAITYPLPLDFLHSFPGWATDFELLYRQEYSRTAGGRTLAKDLGDPLWQLKATSISLSANELDEWRARLESLEGGLKTFRAFKKSRCFPIAYPGGSWPGNTIGTITAQGDFLTAPASAYSVSRASTATYFDSTGTMRTAAANEARFDHDPGNVNVVWPSEDYTPARWNKSNSSIESGPIIGGYKFTRLVPNTNEGVSHGLLQSIYFPVLENDIRVTAKVIAISDGEETKRIALRCSDTAGYISYQYFDLIDAEYLGGAGSTDGIVSTIKSTEHGMCYITVTWTVRATSTATNFQIYAMHPTATAVTYGFNGADGYLISACQLNMYSNTAKPYVKTVTGPAAQYRGLMVEEERRNGMPQSNNAAAAAFTGTGLIRNANMEVAPNGATEAALLIENTDNSTHQNAAPVNLGALGAIAGTEFWASTCLKMANPGRRYVQAWTQNYANQLERTQAFIDLATGEFHRALAGVNPKCIVQNAGNGFWRIAIRGVYAGSGSSGITVSMQQEAGTSNSTYQGDGVSGIYQWGTQIEIGSAPTSLIPTGGSAATRNADILTINNAGGNDWTLTYDDAPAQTISRVQGNLVAGRGDMSGQWLRSFDARLVDPVKTLSGVKVYSINANRKAIRLSGLPAGYRVSVGDHIQIGPISLHSAQEAVTVPSTGISPEFEIRPHLWPAAAVGDDVLMVKPSCVMAIVPGSISSTAEVGTGRGTISFQAVEAR